MNIKGVEFSTHASASEFGNAPGLLLIKFGQYLTKIVIPCRVVKFARDTQYFSIGNLLEPVLHVFIIALKRFLLVAVPETVAPAYGGGGELNFPALHNAVV